MLDAVTLPDGGLLKYTYENYLTPMNGRTQWDRMTKVERFAAAVGGETPALLGTTTYHYEDGRFPYHLTGITDATGAR